LVRKKNDKMFEEQIQRMVTENEKLKRKLKKKEKNKTVRENNNLSNDSSSDASDSETGKTGFEPGDVFAIGDIMDEVDSVTELYVLRAQVTNKSYGISTW
ncbi:16750_t:CDS:2, partial [Dentiscutata erythropus]